MKRMMAKINNGTKINNVIKIDHILALKSEVFANCFNLSNIFFIVPPFNYFPNN